MDVENTIKNGRSIVPNFSEPLSKKQKISHLYELSQSSIDALREPINMNFEPSRLIQPTIPNEYVQQLPSPSPIERETSTGPNSLKSCAYPLNGMQSIPELVNTTQNQVQNISHTERVPQMNSSDDEGSISTSHNGSSDSEDDLPDAKKQEGLIRVLSATIPGRGNLFDINFF